MRWLAPLLRATRFTPFEEFHSPAAVPHHCGRYPLAVRPHRARRAPKHSTDRNTPQQAIPHVSSADLLPFERVNARVGQARQYLASRWPKPSSREIRFSTPPKRRCSPHLATGYRVSCDSGVAYTATRPGRGQVVVTVGANRSAASAKPPLSGWHFARGESCVWHASRR